MMFVHVKYGKERGDRVMEFRRKTFATAHDVIDRALPAYGGCCTFYGCIMNMGENWIPVK